MRTRVAAALQHAGDAVAVLPTDLTAVVLRRLVVAVTDCHHDGVAHSTRLAVCLHSASVALHLDPRWVDTNTTPDSDPTRPGFPHLPRPTTARATPPAALQTTDRLI